ncbi:MAG: hypothetical protein BGO43_07650 [Gammaproteobacteria bacterium 39-13]|nr:hypothetical protein [Gammaproteobacteria bacterium]OJV93042.1 MAG: hypothetical protein BGO43_07650 [Gammaproteobacteria bacterium 39-13]
MINIQKLATMPPLELQQLEQNFEVVNPRLHNMVKQLKKQPFDGEKLALVDTIFQKQQEAELLLAEIRASEIDLEHKIGLFKDLMKQLVQDFSEAEKSFPQEYTTLFQMAQIAINQSMPTSRFLQQPIGLKEIAWLMRYRINQLQAIKEPSFFQEELLSLTQMLQEEFYHYKEGNIDTITKMEEKINTFLMNHENEGKKVAWLRGLNQECAILLKRHEAVQLRHQLDEINIELMSRKNTAQLQYVRDINSLDKKYKRKPKPKVQEPTTLLGKLWKGIKSAASFFNFVQDYREHRYLVRRIELKEKFHKENQEIQRSHQEKYGAKIAEITSHFTRLKNEISQMDEEYIGAVIAPLSFQNHREIKEMIVLNGGMMVGGFAQNKVIALGSSAGLCYGFTKEWVMQINSLRRLHLDEHIMIDKLDMYSKKTEDGKSAFVNQVDNLKVNENIYKHFDSQIKDKITLPTEFKQIEEIKEDFPAKILSNLEKTNPPSFIINVSRSGGASGHALGVAKTEHGIWFHDSNYGCAFFPQSEHVNAKFSQFFNQYMKRVYPEYNQGGFIPIHEEMEPDKRKSLIVGFENRPQEEDRSPVKTPSKGNTESVDEILKLRPV